MSRTSIAQLALSLLFVSSVPLATPSAAEPPHEGTLTFESDILPIFAEHCHDCHSRPDAEGSFRLDTMERLLAGGESGSPLEVGNAKGSYLVELIESGDMPPGKKQRLAPDQVELIRRWIDQGAKSTKTAAVEDTTFAQINHILLLRCVACHGAQKQEGGLDLRTRESIARGGKSGSAIDVDHPAQSRLLKRIRSGEMPPKRRLVESSSKPIEPPEIQRLAEWIAQGAPGPIEDPRSATNRDAGERAPDATSHWAFNPVVKPDLPEDAADPPASGNPIDRFVRTRLRTERLAPARRARPEVLLRRIHFDIIGLPPTSAEVQSFLAAARNDEHAALESVIDRLLESPRYGERWGRYWLDLAGYSDSEGVQHADQVRENAWRYRDYVIRSLNDDKPYDQFLMEQIAGDELAEFRGPDGVSSEVFDNLVATGFLRMAPDGTGANITNFVPDRLDVIHDEMEILSATMGLTVGCARCHSHKFDPITHRNYYGLLAIFKGAYDEHDWLKPYGAGDFSNGPFRLRRIELLTVSEKKAWDEQQKAIDGEIQTLQHKLAVAQQMHDASESEQTKAEVDRIKKVIQDAESRRGHPTRIRALWDRGAPSPTYLLRRGNHLTPGRRVEPHVPEFIANIPFDIQPPPSKTGTGRRLAFAKWLTHASHPLTARVMVNRVWKHHFGRGIVPTLDNFGVAGLPPSHPELLDWLAADFVEHGWRLKRLHRMILLSDTYCQSSEVSEQAARSDPENRFLSHAPLRRLDAESLRDSLIFVAGKLVLDPFGPPDAVDVRPDGLVTSKRRSPQATEGGWRRTIYVQQRRTEIPTILENFDLPRMGPNCVERPESTVAPQALHLLNYNMIHDLARHWADGLLKTPDDAASNGRWKDIIAEVYLTAYGRPVSAQELASSQEFLDDLSERWTQTKGIDQAESRIRSVTNFCHAIMNSAEFIYVD